MLIAAETWANPKKEPTNSTFANCHNLEEDEKTSNIPLEKDKRMTAMEQLVLDLRRLHNEIDLPPNLSPFPMAFLRTCRDKKLAMLSQHNSLATESIKDSAVYFKVYATLAMINGQRSRGQARANYYQEAFKLFDRVVEKDPRDWSAKQDRVMNFHRYHAAKWEMSNKVNMSQSEMDDFLATSSRYIDEIGKDKNAPANVKIDLLSSRSSMINSFMTRNSESTKDTDSILEIDKNNKGALLDKIHRLAKLNLCAEAIPYLERFLTLLPNAEKETQIYFDCMYKVKDFQKISLKGTNSKKAFPKNARIHAVAARAKWELKFVDLARSENLQALRLDPNDEIARNTQSLILEMDGEEYLKANSLASAIGNFDSAFRFDPKRLTLRKKVASVVFLYRKSLNFDPPEAALIEMKQIVDLLFEYRALPEINQDGLEILLEAGFRSQQFKKAVDTCKTYEDTLGVITSPRMLRICGESYLKGGNRANASELLGKAFQLEKSSEQKAELRALIKEAN